MNEASWAPNSITKCLTQLCPSSMHHPVVPIGAPEGLEVPQGVAAFGFRV